MEWTRDEYVLTAARERVDVAVVHGYLTRSYWAEGIPRATVERSLDHSLCLNLWHAPSGLDGEDAAHVGFARVVSDFATVAYLGDVFVLDPHRGRGLSRWMMETLNAHPRLQGLRRWILLTRDAHGLYEKCGWTKVARPDRSMERWDPDVYRR